MRKLAEDPYFNGPCSIRMAGGATVTMAEGESQATARSRELVEALRRFEQGSPPNEVSIMGHFEDIAIEALTGVDSQSAIEILMRVGAAADDDAALEAVVPHISRELETRTRLEMDPILNRYASFLGLAGHILLGVPDIRNHPEMLERARTLLRDAARLYEAGRNLSGLAMVAIDLGLSFGVTHTQHADLREARVWFERALEYLASAEEDSMTKEAEGMARCNLAQVIYHLEGTTEEGSLEVMSQYERAFAILSLPSPAFLLDALLRWGGLIADAAKWGFIDEPAVRSVTSKLEALRPAVESGGDSTSKYLPWMLFVIGRLHMTYRDEETHTRNAIDVFMACSLLLQQQRSSLVDATLVELNLGWALLSLPEPSVSEYTLGRKLLLNCLRSSGGFNDGQYVLTAAHRLGVDDVRRGLWPDAAAHFATALKEADRVYGAALGTEERDEVSSMIGELHHALALACARSGDAAGAAIALDGGRARWLTGLQRPTSTALAALRAADPALYAQYLEQLAALRGLQSVERHHHALSILGRRASEEDAVDRALARSHLESRELISKLRTLDGLDQFLQQSPAPFAPIFKREPATALVYLNVTPHGADAIIVRESETESIALDVRYKLLSEVTEPYFVAYDKWREAPFETDHRTGFDDAISALGAWLWPHIVAPVLEATDRAEKVVFLPCGSLNALPLHAAWTVDLEAGDQRSYALDRKLIVFAPNAQLYLASLEREETTSRDRVVTVADPQPTSLGELREATWEVRVAAMTFDEHNVLAGPSAQKAPLLEQIREASVVHLALHARYIFAAPMLSHLVLACDELMLLNEIADSELLAAPLVVLSACETGIVDLSEPDELLGFAAAFLNAGATAVLATLWSVPDDSTLLLMTKFYESWRIDGFKPSEALRVAQQWMRGTNNGEKAEHFHPDTRTWLGLQESEHLYELLNSLPAETNDFASPLNWLFAMNRGSWGLMVGRA